MAMPTTPLLASWPHTAPPRRLRFATALAAASSARAARLGRHGVVVATITSDARLASRGITQAWVGGRQPRTQRMSETGTLAAGAVGEYFTYRGGTA